MKLLIILLILSVTAMIFVLVEAARNRCWRFYERLLKAVQVYHNTRWFNKPIPNSEFTLPGMERFRVYEVHDIIINPWRWLFSTPKLENFYDEKEIEMLTEVGFYESEEIA